MNQRNQENLVLSNSKMLLRRSPVSWAATGLLAACLLSSGCNQVPTAPEQSEFFPLLPAHNSSNGDYASANTNSSDLQTQVAPHGAARIQSPNGSQVAPIQTASESLVIRAQNGYYGDGSGGAPPTQIQNGAPQNFATQNGAYGQPNQGGTVVVNQGGGAPQNFGAPQDGAPQNFVVPQNMATQNIAPGQPAFGGPIVNGPPGPAVSSDPTYGLIDPENNNFADIDAFVQEARTGRFMFGVGVNSDAGVTGQIVIDERNFDYRAIPTQWSDFANGKAFRGGGQGFRIEALPGTQVQRYMASFTQPYLFDTPVSMTISGFFFDRNYFDWDEQRLGGRLAFGYRLRPDLSVSAAIRGEQVDIHSPRVNGVADLDNVLGDNYLYSGRVAITHDTRDSAFAPTDGHMLEVSYEQAFGTFDYPRVELDWRQYYLLYQRPDTSGRHTISYNIRGGITGPDTPIYENFFAGGFSTIRGFDFRGASPKEQGVTVGGELRLLGSVEYQFPLTPDDMLKGVVFCDFGTVEEKIKIEGDDFRVAPGFGLRIAVPALGPAPLALDLAFPVAREDTDDIRNFSFFIGIGR